MVSVSDGTNIGGDHRFGFAYWTGVAGDPAGARDQYAALRPVEERVLGPKHPDTPDVRDNLAYWTRKLAKAGVN